MHDPLYVRWLNELAPTEPLLLDADTYLLADTYEAAVHSAGCAITALRTVMSGHHTRAFALCRPPVTTPLRTAPGAFASLTMLP